MSPLSVGGRLILHVAAELDPVSLQSPARFHKRGEALGGGRAAEREQPKRRRGVRSRRTGGELRQVDPVTDPDHLGRRDR